MEGKAFGKKVLGFAGQILLIAAGSIAGILILEQMRKPRIAPPAPSSTPAQA